MFSNSYSQTWTAIATSTATVVKPVSITLSGSGSLDFGEIIVTPSLQERFISNQEGQRFLVTGHPGRSVIISYPPSISLSNSAWVAVNGGTTSTVTFNANTVTGTGSNSNYTSPVNISSGSGVVLPTVDNSGLLYIWLGGTINIEANKPPGNYTGSFTISVSY